MKLFVITIFIAIIFFGCKPKKKDKTTNASGSEDQTEAKSPGGFVVEKETDLPECDDSLKSTLVFIEELKIFKTCKQGSWTKLDIKNESTTINVTDADLTEAWRRVWKEDIQSVASIGVVWGDPENKCPLMPEPSGRGSGFIVDKNLIASNAHVVKPEFELTLNWENNQEMKDQVHQYCAPLIKKEDSKEVVLLLSLKQVGIWYPVDATGKTDYKTRNSDAVVTKIDRSLADSDDLVLLGADTKDHTPLELSPRNEADETKEDPEKIGVYLGEKIMILGFSASTDYAHFVTGRINGFKKSTKDFFPSIAENKLVYEYDAVTGTGASGGPIVDINGKVVAIHFAGDTTEAGTEFGFGIQVRHLRDLLPNERKWSNLAGFNVIKVPEP